MATVADVRAVVADMLARSDLNDQIDREVINACKELERESIFISQVAEFKLTTVANQEWYTSLDLSAAIPAEGTNSSAALPVERVLKVNYLKGTPTGQTTEVEISRLHFSDFQRLSEGASSAGWPTYYTIFGHRLGLWPVPGEVFTIEGDGVIKPVAPTDSSSESAFIDQAEDLVVSLAAERVARRYLQDAEMASAYAADASRLVQSLLREDTKKRGAGRLQARM